MFSKACEYGLRAIIYIAQCSQSDAVVSMTHISEAIDSPQAFTAKILQQLTRDKIITSVKGPHGGFVIEPHMMKTTTLSQVVKIIDGDAIYMGCGLGLSQCNEASPCPLHFKFIAIREELKKMLENTTLEILVNDMSKQLFFFKR
jgi:Rrf2 family transcriptional regulator, iron-sulfur cluster assembly transcription factor